MSLYMSDRSPVYVEACRSIPNSGLPIVGSGQIRNLPSHRTEYVLFIQRPQQPQNNVDLLTGNMRNIETEKNGFRIFAGQVLCLNAIS